MALLFCDSFAHYANPNSASGDMVKKWTAVSVPNSASRSTLQDVPGGGIGYVLNCAGQIQAGMNSIASNATTGALGTWIKLTASQFPNGNSVDVFGFSESGTTQVDVGITSNGQLIVARNGAGGTTLAVSARVVPLNTWFFLEFKATIHNTTGIIEARVDGSSDGWIPQLTGQNTRQTANAYFNGIRFMNGNNMTAQYRGLYVLDTSGTVGNDFLGPAKIAVLRPTGKGNYNQWTTTAVDNFDGVGHYIPLSSLYSNTSATVGQIDSFEHDNAPMSAGTVVGIQYNILANRDAVGARTIAPVQRSGGTDYVGTTSAALGTTTTYVREVKAQDPATTANWTLSNLNAAEFGYKLIS